MSWLSQLDVAIPLATLCLLISGFCSGTEVALFSLRRVDREQLARSESVVDKQIIRLLEQPRRLIATVLVGNEAFNSVLAVLALVVISRLVDVDSPWLLGLIALGVTLPLIVLFSEVMAKTIAAKAPLFWSRLAVYPLSAFAVVVAPFRVVVHLLSELLLRPLGDAARTRPARDLSEQEFKSLVDAGSAQGQVDASERRLIHRVFEFSDKNVGQVMTPRGRIFALNYDLPMHRLVREIAARGFSRVPIYQKSLDNVRGIVHAKDLVRAVAGGVGPQKPLAALLHEPLFVPRTTPVKRLFLTFKQKKVHMAIVVSEYGKVLGLVTMDDLLAQIFGVLRDERAELQQSMPNMRANRTRTPVAGVVETGGAPPTGGGPLTGPVPLETGPVPLETGPVPLETGPVPLETGPVPLETGPVSLESGPVSLETGPVPLETGPVSLESGPVPLESAPVPKPVRATPLYPVDEVTPPATDIDELRAQGGDKS